MCASIYDKGGAFVLCSLVLSPHSSLSSAHSPSPPSPSLPSPPLPSPLQNLLDTRLSGVPLNHSETLVDIMKAVTAHSEAIAIEAMRVRAYVPVSVMCFSGTLMWLPGKLHLCGYYGNHTALCTMMFALNYDEID